MNFVKRAFLYCFRQKVKTLILFLVLAIISTFLLTGLAIRDASEERLRMCRQLSAVNYFWRLTPPTNTIRAKTDTV